jgi:hypothetical protein
MDQSQYAETSYPYVMSDVAYDIFAAQFGAVMVRIPSLFARPHRRTQAVSHCRMNR